MNAFKKFFREIRRYPSAFVGLLIIFLLIVLSVYTVISIPYSQAVKLWRAGEEVWYHNPKSVPPAWLNFFRKDKLPVSFWQSSADGTALKEVKTRSNGAKEVIITSTFDYQYDNFPQELALYFKASFEKTQPFVSVLWITPDGREIRITDLGLPVSLSYRFSQDDSLTRILRGKAAPVGLFADPDSETATPLKGTYRVVINGYLTEPGSDFNAEFVLHGKLHGLAGTDHLRRDLTTALLWGTPIALAFGLLAALGTTITTMIIAALGAWYGGWVDEIIQRITEINLVLPFLPILIMIGTFYSRSIWLMLGATILLSIFGSGIKTYRAMFLQVKESPYIEAARSYGASDGRIIFRYLTPRLIPTLIPQLVTLIPTYVFLEASLALLGLGDPVLPTWGKVINDASSNGALYQGLYYWVLEPSILLMITGLAFALLGFALDRIFNPRLREI